MSRITFLDNAAEGKNNWWRYLTTIILTWGTPVVILSIVFFILSRFNPSNLASILSEPLALIVLVGISDMLSLIFLYIGIRFIHERQFISLVNTDSKFSWRRIFKGGGIWFGLLTLGLIITLLLNPTNINGSFNSQNFLILLVISLIVFPVQASFEELFFRGYLMQGIGRIKIRRLHIGLLAEKPVIPLITTSIIFALLHFPNGANTLTSVDIVLQALIIGLTLGIITLGENRLETAMGVHIANNIFVALILNSPNGGLGNIPSLLTDNSAPNLLSDIPIITLYALILLAIIFWGKKERIIRIFK
jgi:membrane protease YdiL (CAAX protease family)